MKRYISPEMVVVEIEAQGIIALSGDQLTLGAETDPNKPGGSTDDPNDLAAPTYRNSLWND